MVVMFDNTSEGGDEWGVRPRHVLGPKLAYGVKELQDSLTIPYHAVQ